MGAVSFSPDGNFVATAEQNRTARVWDVSASHEDLREPRLVTTLIGHAGPVTSAAFSRDGERVLTASSDGTTRVWSRETGQALAVFRQHADYVNEAVFSPTDTNLILSASDDGTARLYRCTTCSLTLDEAKVEARKRLRYLRQP